MTNKRYFILGLLCLLAVGLLSGCGKDKELETFHENMSDFTEQVKVSSDKLNSIDLASETAVEEMLAAIDELAAEFNMLAQMEIPKEFISMEDLAREAGSYMSEAAAYYHQAYEGETFDENTFAMAVEYYNRAIKRLGYISDILQGEIPDDASIVISTMDESENGDENDTDGPAGQEGGTQPPADTSGQTQPAAE